MGGKKPNHNLEEKIDEVLEIVNFIKDRAATKQELLEVKNDLGGRLDNVEKRLTKVESQMVTKDYLDDKMADLRGDLVVMMRKEDNKLKTLLEILQTRKVITKIDATKVMAMEPFAQLALQ